MATPLKENKAIQRLLVAKVPMGRLNAPIPLTKDHRTIGFDCGIDSLNDWLMRLALKNQSGGASRTYVVFDGNQVAGYYAITAGSNRPHRCSFMRSMLQQKHFISNMDL